MNSENALVVFEGKGIRRLFHNDEWFYSVVDIVGALTESVDPRTYWKVLKHRLLEDGSEVVTRCNQLKMPASDGKYYDTDCANIETLFRIIQAIPSPKAEPFKLWLARVGYERVQEVQNPELAQSRMKELYRLKGYSDDWIEKRVRGISIRNELTDEWKKRNVKEGKEFAILTNEISKATFGKTVEEYKELKGLERENLRDHMNDLELIFGMLGERVSTEITRVEDARGFPAVENSARRGGTVAGNARKETEKEIGRPITSTGNYLSEPEKKKRLGRNCLKTDHPIVRFAHSTAELWGIGQFSRFATSNSLKTLFEFWRAKDLQVFEHLISKWVAETVAELRSIKPILK